MRNTSLALRCLAVGAAAAVLATGCSSSSSDSSGNGSQTITLYNAQHEQTTDALATAFTKQTGIKVKVRSNGEDVLTAQLEQEGSKSPADVFYTENSPWLAQLDEKHLLAPIDAASLQQVPATDSASTGDWIAVSARVSVLVYNKDKLTAAQLPTSIMDLADPKWKGKLELAPAETDFWPIVSSVAKTYGDAKALAWLKGLKSNAAPNDNIPDNETVVSDVNKGTAEMGLINHYYFYRLQTEMGKPAVHSALSFFAPHDPGYLLDISGAGILKSSKHLAAAQKFVAFITSAAGQTILANSDSFEYPIGDHVAASPELPPFSSLQPSSFSVADLGTGEDAKTLLQEAQLL
ncbi:MAG TPA: extracellular solute-binding protein [Acidothermaceae bacterium]|nr:extracellular solute-binding protein [Acidothermaceae bacterium]